MNFEYTNSIFEESWWLNTVAPGRWKEIVIEKDGKIAARWAFCSYKSRIIMPVLTQTCSPWFLLDVKKSERENNEYMKPIINELLEKVNSYKSISIMLDSTIGYFLPFYWNGFHITPMITYQISALNNLETVFNNFSKNIRRDIKSAEKKLHISYEFSAEILYSIMEKTFSEQKRKYPIDRGVIDNIIQNSREHNAGQMISAIDADGNVHAAAFFLYDKRRCYYLIGGKDPSYKNSNGLTLVIWEGIKFASTVSEIFDFEGSMIEGIENYFRRFAGKPVVYYHITRQNMFFDIADIMKPHVKKLIGYKI